MLLLYRIGGVISFCAQIAASDIIFMTHIARACRFSSEIIEIVLRLLNGRNSSVLTKFKVNC